MGRAWLPLIVLAALTVLRWLGIIGEPGWFIGAGSLGLIGLVAFLVRLERGDPR
jgi:hypothetical protein